MVVHAARDGRFCSVAPAGDIAAGLCSMISHKSWSHVLRGNSDPDGFAMWSLLNPDTGAWYSDRVSVTPAELPHQREHTRQTRLRTPECTHPFRDHRSSGRRGRTNPPMNTEHRYREPNRPRLSPDPPPAGEAPLALGAPAWSSAREAAEGVSEPAGAWATEREHRRGHRSATPSDPSAPQGHPGYSTAGVHNPQGDLPGRPRRSRSPSEQPRGGRRVAAERAGERAGGWVSRGASSRSASAREDGRRRRRGVGSRVEDGNLVSDCSSDGSLSAGRRGREPAGHVGSADETRRHSSMVHSHSRGRRQDGTYTGEEETRRHPSMRHSQRLRHAGSSSDEEEPRRHSSMGHSQSRGRRQDGTCTGEEETHRHSSMRHSQSLGRRQAGMSSDEEEPRRHSSMGHSQSRGRRQDGTYAGEEETRRHPSMRPSQSLGRRQAGMSSDEEEPRRQSSVRNCQSRGRRQVNTYADEEEIRRHSSLGRRQAGSYADEEELRRHSSMGHGHSRGRRQSGTYAGEDATRRHSSLGAKNRRDSGQRGHHHPEQSARLHPTESGGRPHSQDHEPARKTNRRRRGGDPWFALQLAEGRSTPGLAPLYASPVEGSSDTLDRTLAREPSGVSPLYVSEEYQQRDQDGAPFLGRRVSTDSEDTPPRKSWGGARPGTDAPGGGDAEGYLAHRQASSRAPVGLAKDGYTMGRQASSNVSAGGGYTMGRQASSNASAGGGYTMGRQASSNVPAGGGYTMGRQASSNVSAGGGYTMGRQPSSNALAVGGYTMGKQASSDSLGLALGRKASGDSDFAGSLDGGEAPGGRLTFEAFEQALRKEIWGEHATGAELVAPVYVGSRGKEGDEPADAGPSAFYLNVQAPIPHVSGRYQKMKASPQDEYPAWQQVTAPGSHCLVSSADGFWTVVLTADVYCKVGLPRALVSSTKEHRGRHPGSFELAWAVAGPSGRWVEDDRVAVTAKRAKHAPTATAGPEQQDSKFATQAFSQDEYEWVPRVAPDNGRKLRIPPAQPYSAGFLDSHTLPAIPGHSAESRPQQSHWSGQPVQPDPESHSGRVPRGGAPVPFFEGRAGGAARSRRSGAGADSAFRVPGARDGGSLRPRQSHFPPERQDERYEYGRGYS
ncbi:hypothetical protein DIPPA_29654 [Diplonema papillatum]|nr:hypothetical protein DIPPA_29654 [Diplonema papillatum]